MSGPSGRRVFLKGEALLVSDLCGRHSQVG